MPRYYNFFSTKQEQRLRTNVPEQQSIQRSECRYKISKNKSEYEKQGKKIV